MEMAVCIFQLAVNNCFRIDGHVEIIILNGEMGLVTATITQRQKTSLFFIDLSLVWASFFHSPLESSLSLFFS